MEPNNLETINHAGIMGVGIEDAFKKESSGNVSLSTYLIFKKGMWGIANVVMTKKGTKYNKKFKNRGRNISTGKGQFRWASSPFKGNGRRPFKGSSTSRLRESIKGFRAGGCNLGRVSG